MDLESVYWNCESLSWCWGYSPGLLKEKSKQIHHSPVWTRLCLMRPVPTNHRGHPVWYIWSTSKNLTFSQYAIDVTKSWCCVMVILKPETFANVCGSIVKVMRRVQKWEHWYADLQSTCHWDIDNGQRDVIGAWWHLVWWPCTSRLWLLEWEVTCGIGYNEYKHYFQSLRVNADKDGCGI